MEILLLKIFHNISNSYISRDLKHTAVFSSIFILAFWRGWVCTGMPFVLWSSRTMNLITEFAPHFTDSSDAIEKSEGKTHIVCKQENNFCWDLLISSKWFHRFAVDCCQWQQGAITRTVHRERFLDKWSLCEKEKTKFLPSCSKTEKLIEEENWKRKHTYIHKQLVSKTKTKWHNKPGRRDNEGIMESKNYLDLYLFIN